MRHASIETTFDTYGHLFPETNAKVIEMIDRALSGANGVNRSNYFIVWTLVLVSNPKQSQQ